MNRFPPSGPAIIMPMSVNSVSRPRAVLNALIIAIVLGLSVGPSSGVGEEGGCILYGAGWAVFLSPPQGWELTCQDPSTKVQAALWLEGSTWKDSVAVMYVNSAGLTPGESLEEFVNNAVAGFKGHQPSVKVTEEQPIRLSSGKSAIVRQFIGDQWGNHEVVAYVDAGAGRLMFVLSSRRKEEFIKFRSAHKSLVTGARLMKSFSPGE